MCFTLRSVQTRYGLSTVAVWDSRFPPDAGLVSGEHRVSVPPEPSPMWNLCGRWLLQCRLSLVLDRVAVDAIMQLRAQDWHH